MGTTSPPLAQVVSPHFLLFHLPPVDAQVLIRSLSGAISAIIAFYACVRPTATFLVFYVIPCPAWAVVAGLFLFDGYSAYNESVRPIPFSFHVQRLIFFFSFLLCRWVPKSTWLLQRPGVDSAGHVGGLLAGMAYFLRLRLRRF